MAYTSTTYCRTVFYHTIKPSGYIYACLHVYGNVLLEDIKVR